jgi:tetratricopeptide (TPR) repeat protein
MLRVVLAIAVLLAADAARAQKDDDWSVQKNPFDRRVVDRWKAIVLKDPWDAGALKKLTDLYRRYSTADKLIAELEPTTWNRAVVLGHLYRMRPDVDKALAAYAQALALSPPPGKAARIHVARADLYKAKGNAAAAHKEYADALAAGPAPADRRTLLRALADLELDDGNIAAAAAHFKEYIDLDPKDVTARVDYADALAKHDRGADALAEYEEAEKRLGTDPGRRIEVMVRRGGVLAALGRDDDAVAVYQKAEAELPRAHFLRREIAERTIAIYRKKQDLRGLVAVYEKGWRDRGHFEWETLGRLYEETGDVDKALECYRKAVAAAPSELETHRRLIAVLERTGRDDEALRQYETLVRVAPGEPRFQIELAERVFRKGDRARALALLKAVAARFYSDPGVHAALADLYSRWGEDKLALAEYEALTRLEPGDETHLVNLGEQYFQRGDKARAVDVWKRLAGAKTAEGAARLAEVYGEHDMGAEAIEMYQKSLQLKPKDPALWRGYAAVLERQRQDDRALDAWEKVIELAGADAAHKALRREARARIVVILYRKPGSPLLAKIGQWRTRFQAAPPDLESGYRLVEAYLKLGRHEEAERVLAAILRADPKDLDAKAQLVVVYKMQKKYAPAIALLKELAADQPALERQYFQEISELELALYHDDQAVAFAQKALEKNPNDAGAQERLGEIHAKRGDLAAAVEAYRRAIALDPRNVGVRFALATLYVNADRTREAAQLYRDIVRTAGEEETVRKAARKAMTLEEHDGTLGELERDLAPLAFLPGAKPFYRKILVELYDRYARPLILAARDGDAAAQKELVRLGEPGLKPLLEALEDATDPQQQRAAAYLLGYIGNKNAAAPLVKLAADEGTTGARKDPAEPRLDLGPDSGAEMDLRVEAAVAAGRLADPRVIHELAGLTKNREVALREAAVWALGQTRSPKAADALVAALADSRQSVHALACVGLGRVGDRRALDKAADVVRDKARAPEVRAACAYALGVARSDPHASALVELLGAGNDEAQVKAAWALGRLGDAKAVPALVRAVYNRRPAIRDAALWALARVGRGDDRPVAAEDVALERDKIDYRRMVRDLGPDLAPGPVPPAAVDGQGQAIAEAIVAALGSGRRDITLRTLRDLDADPAGLSLGPLGAARPLVAIVAPAVVAPAGKLAEDKDPEVRALAASVLAKTGDAGAPARIERLLADETREVRVAALRAAATYLARARGAGGLAARVAERTGAKDGFERAAAVEALGSTPGADLTPLVPALSGPDGFVREAAARALGARAQAFVKPLLDATRDDVPEVRLAAVVSLRNVPDAAVRERLKELADGDPSPTVRKEAGR